MIRSSTVLLVASILGTAGAAGCVNDAADAPMRILRNIAPAEGCVIDSGSDVFNDDGIIDAQSDLGYIFTPVVSNDLTLVTGESDVQKTIFMEGAEVTIAFYDTDLFPAANFDARLLHFVTPVGGSVAPGGGVASFSFEIVPQQLLAAMTPTIETQAGGFRTTLDVRVQMFGTKGGGDVESNIFRYPVQVCLGCLVANVGACADLPNSYIPRTGGACNILQDGVLDCCVTGGGGLLCPATPPEGA